MRRLSLPRPHLCDAPNHYSATRALTLFLSIDTGVPSRPGHSASRYISSIHAVNDTISISATIPDNGRSVMTRRRPPPQRQNRDADVIVGDLRATLEAHRATNRASIIRAIPSDNLLPDNFVRPAIQYVQNEGQDTKGKVGQRAPRGDVVDQEMKTQPSTTFYRPLLSLDGETAGQSAGMSFYWPVGQWSRSGHTPMDIGRPWLDHLDEESGDGLLR